MRKPTYLVGAILVITAAVYLLSALMVEPSKAPSPSVMPPVVQESMEDLLRSLEVEMEKYQPGITQHFKPGISPEKLEHAEAILGQTIHPEMRALYGWHNGLADAEVLFPGHGFWSLEDAIRTNQELTVSYKEKGVSFLMAHEESWLILFPDAGGDGYYYDPKRLYETGGIFYNFREVGYYRYFPSIKNLLKAIVECYQQGAYLQGREPDFDLEEQIFNQYGSAVEQ